MFRIGGKTDPGRFVTQHQQQFLILGFHDEERSDQAVSDDAFGRHNFRMGFGSLPSCSSGRNTLSPVREHHGDAELVCFIVMNWYRITQLTVYS